jgi:hypothetical protein
LAESASAEAFTTPLRVEILDYWDQRVTKDLDETALIVSKAVLTDSNYSLVCANGKPCESNSLGRWQATSGFSNSKGVVEFSALGVRALPGERHRLC